MRNHIVGLRLAILAVAALQLAVAPLAAVAEGLVRRAAPVLDAHVEELGSKHDTHAHPHECATCRALRPLYLAPEPARSLLAFSALAAAPDGGTTVASSRTALALRARGPPAGIG